MLKVIPIRSQMERRNLLLETGGEVILVIKWPRAWPTCVLGFCGGAHLVSHERGRLAEEIPKQSAGGLLMVKCKKMDELKEELFSKKELECEDLESPQPVRGAGNEEAGSEENAEGVAGPSRDTEVAELYAQVLPVYSEGGRVVG